MTQNTVILADFLGLPIRRKRTNEVKSSSISEKRRVCVEVYDMCVKIYDIKKVKAQHKLRTKAELTKPFSKTPEIKSDKVNVLNLQNAYIFFSFFHH